MLAQHLLIEELLLKLMLLLSKGLEKRVQLLLGRLVCMNGVWVKNFFFFLSFLKKFFFKKKSFTALLEITQVWVQHIILITSIIILVDQVLVVLLQLLRDYV